jgi:hypothetical protein
LWESYGTHKYTVWAECRVKFVPHRKHYVSATKPNRLMLFREITAVYCENHTEHTNTLCRQNAVYINSVRTSRETHYVSATKTNRLILFREIIAVYCCENHTEHVTNVNSILEFTPSTETARQIVLSLWNSCYNTTDGQSAGLSGCQAPSRAEDQIFIIVRQLRVCRLQLVLVLISAVTHGSESQYFTLSDLKLSQPGEPGPRIHIPPGTGWRRYTPRRWVTFSSPLTTRRDMVEVFEPASTRGLKLEVHLIKI